MANQFWLALLFFLLHFKLVGFDNLANNTDLTLVRSVEIRSDRILQLTNTSSRIVGRAFYPKPIRFTNSTSFSTSFVFAMVQKFPGFGGMGFAFAFAPTPFLPGQPAEYLGLLNATANGTASNRLFEFDPFQDFEFLDPNDNHVGVDINSLKSSSVANASYYLSDGVTLANLTIKNGTTIVVWIDYDASTRFHNVTLAPLSVAMVSKPPRPIISYPVDIAPIVGDTTYVGFSASTGLLSSSHYIFGWSFSLNGPADALDYKKLPSHPNPKPPKSKLRGVVIGTSVASGVLLVASVVAGIWVYRKMNEG